MRFFCACAVVWTVILLSGASFYPVGGAEAPGGPTNAVTSVQSLPPQPEGTRKMIQRLQNIHKRANPFLNPFLSDMRAEALQGRLGLATNAAQQIQIHYELGRALTEAGQPETALQEYKKMEDLAASSRQPLNEDMQVQLRMRKCIAFLRLGELENCLMNHNAVSCIFPLQPAAYHQLPRGSRGAIALLDEQLGLYPDDLGARWLLNIAHMTLGEYPDKVPARWLIPPKVFASDCEFPRFPNVAGALGLDLDGLAGGIILDDFDNDGFIDIVISNWAWDGQLRYFHNDGNGHFTERTKEAGLLGLCGGLNIQQTDYNNDGLLDIWVSRGAWQGKQGRMPGSLLRNNGDGTFTDVTEQAGLLHIHPSQASVWFDYDGDGWLDLFIGCETTDPNDPDPCELFHNNHDGTFTRCGAASGLNVKAFVKAATSADYDHDGRPDLYLSIRDGANLLFHNDGPDASGQWHFSEVGVRAGVTEPKQSFSTWFFDYDNDGWEDIFVSGYHIQNVGDVAADYLGVPNGGTQPKLYHNNHDGTFSDVTAAAHLNHVFLTMGCNFGDLDNDGWLDFYLGTGDPDFSTLVPNRMYRNAEGKFFQDVTTAGGFGSLQKGHAVGFADLDNDGDQDVFIVLGGAFPGDNGRCALFLNPGNTNHWVKLKLEGTKSNRAAIGAKINVTVATPNGPRSIYKTVNSGGSFGSSPLRQEIGLGNATAIDSVEIFWPASGLTQKLFGLSLDHAYRVREGDAQAVAWNLKRIEFDTTAEHPHVHHAMKMGP